MFRHEAFCLEHLARFLQIPVNGKDRPVQAAPKLIDAGQVLDVLQEAFDWVQLGIEGRQPDVFL